MEKEMEGWRERDGGMEIEMEKKVNYMNYILYLCIYLTIK